MDTRLVSAFNKSSKRFLGARLIVVDAATQPLIVLKILMEGLPQQAKSGLWLMNFRGVPVARANSPFDLVYLDDAQCVVQAIEITRTSVFEPFRGNPDSALILPPDSIARSKTYSGDPILLTVVAAEQNGGSAASQPKTPSVHHAGRVVSAAPQRTIAQPATVAASGSLLKSAARNIPAPAAKATPEPAVLAPTLGATALEIEPDEVAPAHETTASEAKENSATDVPEAVAAPEPGPAETSATNSFAALSEPITAVQAEAAVTEPSDTELAQPVEQRAVEEDRAAEAEPESTNTVAEVVPETAAEIVLETVPEASPELALTAEITGAPEEAVPVVPEATPSTEIALPVETAVAAVSASEPVAEPVSAPEPETSAIAEREQTQPAAPGELLLVPGEPELVEAIPQEPAIVAASEDTVPQAAELPVLAEPEAKPEPAAEPAHEPVAQTELEAATAEDIAPIESPAFPAEASAPVTETETPLIEEPVESAAEPPAEIVELPLASLELATQALMSAPAADAASLAEPSPFAVLTPTGIIPAKKKWPEPPPELLQRWDVKLLYRFFPDLHPGYRPEIRAPRVDYWNDRSAKREDELPAKVKFFHWLYPRLHLDTVAQRQREARRAPRIASPGLVGYFFTGGRSKPCEIKSISVTGFFMKTDERWAPGTVVRVTLQVKGSDGSNPNDTITVQSRVVNWGPEGGGFEFVLPGFLEERD